MKIIVFGTRGVPNVPGGVETHCEMLYPAMLSTESLDITVICRSSYIPASIRTPSYKGIKLKYIYAPKSKIFEAIVHSFLSAIYAIKKRPHAVHVHAIGPSLVIPLIRLFGIKVIMTHHGPDYQRQKWRTIPKLFLKLGEWCGVKFSNSVIVISREIAEHISKRYKRTDAYLIPNGVSIPPASGKYDYLQKLNLEHGQYILALGRFVPEKGFDYLIRAFKSSGVSDQFRLVIAGDADHETPYSSELKELAKREGVILTGFIKGEPLNQLFRYARLFVLPSFYEGLPITLLEAMAYDLKIVVSDIRANLEVNLPEDCYFKAGDEAMLAERLQLFLSDNRGKPDYDMRRYDWTKIGKQTLELYY